MNACASPLTVVSLVALLCSMACSAQDGVAALDAAPRADESSGVAAVQEDLTSSVYGTVTYIGDIPSNKTTDWYQHAQGVALAQRSGSVNMFYSTNNRIYGREAQSSSQFGVSQSMPALHWEHGIPKALSDLKFNHFGDLDFEHVTGGDVLLVPMERDGHDVAVVAAFVVSDPNFLVFDSYSFLTGNRGEAPWIAASKTNPSQLYSSRFNTSTIIAYSDSNSGPGVNLNPGSEILLTTSNFNSLNLTGVQGGEFNLNGRLFLIAEGPNPGVYAFERARHPSSNAPVFRNFDFYPATLTPGRGEEFEGITVGLIDPPAANDRSQIHVILNQSGDIFFKHWSVSQNAAHFNLP